MSATRSWSVGPAWSDLVVSEAVAGEVLPGRLARRLDGYDRRRPPPGRPGCRIEVAGGESELSRALADAGVRAGYAARTVDDQEIGGGPSLHDRDPRRSAGERVLTIWEVPVLESGWTRRLEWRAHQTGPVIALAGFADRAVVTRAREAGAVACLELPCDLDDLIDVVDRVVGATPPDCWPIPARAERRTVLPPPRRNARRHRNLIDPSPWPDREAVAYNTLTWQVTGNEWESMPKARVPTKTGAGESGPRRASGGSRRAPDGPPATTSAPPATLKDLTRQIQRVAGLPEVIAALKNGRSATIDGAWGSASALTAAALGLHAPTTLVILIAHVGDVDDFRDDVATFAGTVPEVFPAWEKLPRELTRR